VTTFLQILCNSVSLAAVYVLLAAGLTVYLGVFGILNFAQGDFATIGGYVTFAVISGLGLEIYAAAIAGVLAGVAVGAVFYFMVLKPLWRAPPISQVLATYGLALLIEGIIEYIAGTTPKAITVSRSSLHFFGAYLADTSAINGGLALALILALFALFYRTRTGRKIRAVAEDAEAARLVGISVPRVTFLVCIVGGTLSCAACVTFLTSLYLTPTVGFSEIFQAFTVVVVAGLGNVVGVLWAGVLVAIADSAASYFLGDAVGQLVGFGIVIAVLLIRPTGLAGMVSEAR
jgi:branched-chain amino acid transport system permease protein